MGTHNICLRGEIKKKIYIYAPFLSESMQYLLTYFTFVVSSTLAIDEPCQAVLGHQPSI